jgi:hypothetical protein
MLVCLPVRFQRPFTALSCGIDANGFARDAYNRGCAYRLEACERDPRGTKPRSGAGTLSSIASVTVLASTGQGTP